MSTAKHSSRDVQRCLGVVCVVAVMAAVVGLGASTTSSAITARSTARQASEFVGPVAFNVKPEIIGGTDTTKGSLTTAANVLEDATDGLGGEAGADVDALNATDQAEAVMDGILRTAAQSANRATTEFIAKAVASGFTLFNATDLMRCFEAAKPEHRGIAGIGDSPGRDLMFSLMLRWMKPNVPYQAKFKGFVTVELDVDGVNETQLNASVPVRYRFSQRSADSDWAGFGMPHGLSFITRGMWDIVLNAVPPSATFDGLAGAIDRAAATAPKGGVIMLYMPHCKTRFPYANSLWCGEHGAAKPIRRAAACAMVKHLETKARTDLRYVVYDACGVMRAASHNDGIHLDHDSVHAVMDDMLQRFMCPNMLSKPFVPLPQSWSSSDLVPAMDANATAAVLRDRFNCTPFNSDGALTPIVFAAVRSNRSGLTYTPHTRTLVDAALNWTDDAHCACFYHRLDECDLPRSIYATYQGRWISGAHNVLEPEWGVNVICDRWNIQRASRYDPTGLPLLAMKPGSALLDEAQALACGLPRMMPMCFYNLGARQRPPDHSPERYDRVMLNFTLLLGLNTSTEFACTCSLDPEKDAELLAPRRRWLLGADVAEQRAAWCRDMSQLQRGFVGARSVFWNMSRSGGHCGPHDIAFSKYACTAKASLFAMIVNDPAKWDVLARVGVKRMKQARTAGSNGAGTLTVVSQRVIGQGRVAGYAKVQKKVTKKVRGPS